MERVTEAPVRQDRPAAMARVRAAVASARAWLRRRDRALPVAPKLLLPLVLLVFVVAGLYGTVATGFIRAQLNDAYADGARGLALSLQAEYAQDRGRAEPLTVFARDLVAADASVVRVRIYRIVDERPVVWASSQPRDVGAYHPDAHDVSPLKTGVMTQTEERLDGDGELVLETIHPIALDGRIDASVGIYTSLRGRDAAVAETVRLIGATVATASVVLVGVLVLVSEGVVLRRLRRMRRAAEAVASGDLSVRLPEGEEPPARDEIVTVARQFDHMVRAVARQRAEIERLAVTDALTELPNRRAFDERLALEIGRADRLRYPLTLSLVDLDGFKSVNDSAGHLAGDEALRRVAQALSGAVRQTDVVARYGGDEFAVIHPGCDATAAAAVGRRARAAVEQLAIPLDAHGALRLSASVGIAEHRGAVANEELISPADAALYRAKSRGGGVEVAARADSAREAPH